MKMRKFAPAVLCLLAAATVSGGEREIKGRVWCDVSGGWFAHNDVAPWVATFTETSFAGGFVLAQWTGGDGDWFGYCPGSVRITSGMGTWMRKGPRTLLYTIVAFSLDAGGEVVCTWKASGRILFDAGCDSGHQSGSIELFDPGMNPFSDEPFHWFPREGTTEIVRMTVDPGRP
jgi:hypothetical protein